MFLRGFSRHWEEFKLLEKYYRYLPIKLSFPQQLYTGFTVHLGLLPLLLSARLWHLCHQTWWAWGLSSQAFRPLSGLCSSCIQDWNFSVAHLPVLLSRPLSRTRRILTCAHLPQGVLFFCWLSYEQFSVKSPLDCASTVPPCLWVLLAFSELSCWFQKRDRIFRCLIVLVSAKKVQVIMSHRDPVWWIQKSSEEVNEQELIWVLMSVMV